MTEKILTKEQLIKLHNAIVEDSNHSGLHLHNFIDTENYLKAQTLEVLEEIIYNFTSPLLSQIATLHKENVGLKNTLNEKSEWEMWASEKIQTLQQQNDELIEKTIGGE